MRYFTLVIPSLTLAITLAACGGGGEGSMVATTAAEPAAQSSTAELPNFHTITTIGSTVDPQNGDQNPYGLTVAPVTAGIEHAGDLIICNFNDAANIEGNGTTIELLHPTPGATPTRLAVDTSLQGCAALALGATGAPWAAAYSANDNPVVSPSGSILNTLAQGPWQGPWGQAFAATAGPLRTSAFYVTNAKNGTLVRVNINSGQPFTYDTIVSGFSVNHGVPGNILAPAGLTYDASSDTLYVVDSNANRVVALSAVSSIPADGISVEGQVFGGTSHANARVVYSGMPLNAPISSALLANGNLVVGNTADNNLIELSPQGTVMATKLVDSGPAGALFGITTTGTSVNNQRIYFNDDNDNTVKMLGM